MSRTGLSPADIAESFRDMCGDGSMEWVYTPMQTWVLLDAADMLDENERLRELVRDMWLHSYCSIAKSREDDDRHIEDVIDRMRELGVDA